MEISAGLRIRNAVDPPMDQGFPVYGSMGGIVYDHNKVPMLLTCYHCVHNPHLKWNHFVIDKPNCIVVNENDQEVGTIVQAIRDETVDIALIKPVAGATLDTDIFTFGKITGARSLTEEEEGNKIALKMHGSVVDHGMGLFTGIAPRTGSYYEGESSLGKHYLNKLIKVTPIQGVFSMVGDSGSFILDANNEVAGMVVMGGSDTTYGIPAYRIEKALKITFKKPL
ncbi:MAG: hypothetical protein P0Y49_05080 [Candidatus Pedobacter colombiensis]|uniref:Serine protease n=1 Tax=Candidatus Pedobacter colombiensis TaxID=3121371 RepID=A0AAJ6B837_9SPHI|nr:hypothetical protein [Pedobacter sp.]WEK20509.1 MAG: hypothetical protein P0Y49_05080 [Pedobacter sp.]